MEVSGGEISRQTIYGMWEQDQPGLGGGGPRDLGQKPKHRKEPSIPGGKTRQLLNTPRIRKAFLRVIQNLEDLKKLINLTLKIQESLHDEKAA